MADMDARMVWVDLEMTGLDPQACSIVEIATLVTDSDLTVIAEGPCLVIHQPDEVLAAMSDFVRDLHARSGLLPRIQSSSVTLEQATNETLAFLAKHVAKGTSPLCGNSVWKDKQFLEKYMPGLSAHLHYRLVDVSTIKELVRRWYPPTAAAPRKKELHRAMDDIRESIAELAHYRARVFAAP